MPVYQLGGVISSFDSPDSGPWGLDVDPSGFIWHAGASTNTIYKLDQSGSVLASFGSPADGPTGLGVDPSGFIWHGDTLFFGVGSIYKLDQSGSVLASFNSPSDNPTGIGVDPSGFIWHGDSNTDRLYKLDQSGSVLASFGSPSSNPQGVGVDPSGFIWHADSGSNAIYRINDETPRGFAPASNPTVGATPPGTATSTTVSATAAPPTATATPPVAHSALSAVATASKPTTTATPADPAGIAGVDATATKPTTTATPEPPRGYAAVPLFDGVPFGEDVRQVIRWDEIELEIRCSQAELDAIVRSLETNAGKFERLDHPDGGFETADPVSETPDNTFIYTPRYAESPVLGATEVHVDTYQERPAAQDDSFYRVTVRVKLAANADPVSGVVEESPGADDWTFRTAAGTIATPRVQRDTEAEADRGTLGFVLNVSLTQAQAAALRATTGHLGASGTTGGERSDADAVDNAPGDTNTLYLVPRDDAQIAEQRYVVRDVELERLDPEGTWYRTRLELLPAAVGATGTLGTGKLGEFRLGDS